MNNVVEAIFPTSMYHSNADKSKEPKEPIQEAIYDFGGANVKSCASIALSKSISKGLVPPGTKLPQQWAPSNMHQNLVTSPSSMTEIDFTFFRHLFNWKVWTFLKKLVLLILNIKIWWNVYIFQFKIFRKNMKYLHISHLKIIGKKNDIFPT